MALKKVAAFYRDENTSQHDVRRFFFPKRSMTEKFRNRHKRHFDFLAREDCRHDGTRLSGRPSKVFYAGFSSEKSPTVILMIKSLIVKVARPVLRRGAPVAMAFDYNTV